MLTLPAYEQDFGVGENLEVMRDGGLGEIEPLADLTTREFSRRGDLLHHPEATVIRQRLEHSHELAIVNVKTSVNRHNIDVFRTIDKVKLAFQASHEGQRGSANPAIIE